MGERDLAVRALDAVELTGSRVRVLCRVKGLPAEATARVLAETLAAVEELDDEDEYKIFALSWVAPLLPPDEARARLAEAERLLARRPEGDVFLPGAYRVPGVVALLAGPDCLLPLLRAIDGVRAWFDDPPDRPAGS